MTRRRASVRRDNLERLVREAGSGARLARIVGTSDSYLSQVRNGMVTAKGTPRAIGDGLAAKLECGMGKPDGWLDEPRGASGDGRASPATPCAQASLVPVETRPTWTGAEYPLVSWVQAGDWTEITGEHGVGEVWSTFPCPVRCSKETFVLRIRGRSMEPKFYEGDLVFVDPHAWADNGKYVVVRLEDTNETMIKQLVVKDGRRHLRATNPDWPDPVVDGNDTIVLCGVVVFKGNMV